MSKSLLIQGALASVFSLSLAACDFSNTSDPVEETALPGQSWTWRNPLPQGNGFSAVAKGNGKWIASLSGEVYVSHDGHSWSLGKANDSLPAFSSVIWDGTRFVGVGWNVTGISTDGLNWTLKQLREAIETPYGLNDVVWNGAQYVAVGSSSDGLILTSPDAQTWTRRTATGSLLNSVIWNGSLFAAVGASGTILTSPDGITWTSQASTARNYLNRVVWTGTKLVAMGGDNGTVQTSTDGIHWNASASALTSWIAELVWTGSRLVAVSQGGEIQVSSDGATWTALSPVFPSSPTGMKWDGSQIVAVGENGRISTSPDGLIWTERSQGSRAWFRTAVWTGTQVMALGDEGEVVTSQNGISWTERDVDSGLSGIQALGSGTGIVVAVGNKGFIKTTPDGASWTGRVSGTLKSLYGVAAGKTGEGFVAVGDSGVILTSPDGVQWTTRTSGTRALLHAAVRAGSRWIAVGNGIVLGSENGTEWQILHRDTTRYFNSVVWTGDSIYVAAAGDGGFGSPGQFLSSVDGLAWNARNANYTNLIWTGHYLVALDGGTDYPTEARVWVSAPGTAWTSKGLGTTNWGIQSLVWTGSRLVALGAYGMILTSP